MDKIDDLTQAKLREWQNRRLQVKDRMQSHPEQTLELSNVLDLMDDEHAAILAGSAANQAPAAARFELQLNVAASSTDDLRKLIEMAVYELQRHIDQQKDVALGERNTHTAGMSGTLGNYQFELDINSDAENG
jgi:hypothetical protein